MIVSIRQLRVFVAVALPRASVSFRTAALRQIVADTPAAGRAFVGTTDFTSLATALAIEPGPSSPGIDTHDVNAVAGELAVEEPGFSAGVASGYGTLPREPPGQRGRGGRAGLLGPPLKR